jgi:hypothetical protein
VIERVCVDVIIRHPARLALPASGFNFAFARFEPFRFAFAPAFALSSATRGARTAPWLAAAMAVDVIFTIPASGNVAFIAHITGFVALWAPLATTLIAIEVFNSFLFHASFAVSTAASFFLRSTHAVIMITWWALGTPTSVALVTTVKVNTSFVCALLAPTSVAHVTRVKVFISFVCALLAYTLVACVANSHECSFITFLAPISTTNIATIGYTASVANELSAPLYRGTAPAKIQGVAAGIAETFIALGAILEWFHRIHRIHHIINRAVI